MHFVFRHFPLKGLAMSLTPAMVMSGANWRFASCNKFRIYNLKNLNISFSDQIGCVNLYSGMV